MVICLFVSDFTLSGLGRRISRIPGILRERELCKATFTSPLPQCVRNGSTNALLSGSKVRYLRLFALA
jgi:hypothetical protein